MDDIHYPDITFERYADDIVCYCIIDGQAHDLWQELKDRFTACNLTLNPDKTGLYTASKRVEMARIQIFRLIFWVIHLSQE